MATSLNPDEVREFLETQRTLIVSTIKKDGAPISHAMWFVYVHEDNAVYFDTQSASLKARNIARDSRVCCLVEAGESYFDLRGVVIQGRCVPVEDPGEIERFHTAREVKSQRIGSGMEEMPEWFAGSREKRRGRGQRVLLKVPLEKVGSWNFGQTREHYTRQR
jgi:nitroimidazol reductase NimA-like FMN-containing flavoprotein (pyridoxamine 5'-phosphate oxidase superfamily)